MTLGLVWAGGRREEWLVVPLGSAIALSAFWLGCRSSKVIHPPSKVIDFLP
ncbi:MAG: hypothetical protein F6K31_27585 [Symploca sp. SIO2G7]|nr:hypothetical protein [Symploca sp. SIO2G7]